MLRICLEALLAQTQQPLEILVCYRETDDQSRAEVDRYRDREPQLVRAVVLGPNDNFAAALDRGIKAAEGDLIALTDDDAEPPADWVSRLPSYFADPQVAAVGGRDEQPVPAGEAYRVGVVDWWGRVVGNHHMGVGPIRDVDIVKGVNCCFRGNLIRTNGIDSRLRGAGNVTHTEMSLCLPLRRQGFRIVYDPSLTVQHHVSVRVDGDNNERGEFVREPFINIVHNSTLSLLDYLGEPRRSVYRAWRLGIGTHKEPGLLQIPRLLIQGQPLSETWARFGATRAGVSAAVETWRLSKGGRQCESC